VRTRMLRGVGGGRSDPPAYPIICDSAYLIDRVCSGNFSLLQSKRLEWILSYS
jgi:hypothetical protein